MRESRSTLTTSKFVMKLKNVFEILGFRGKAKHYGYEEHECALSQGQSVNYARWSHPYEASKTIDPGYVDAYREILSEGDFCVDIGAHTGDSTLPLGLAVAESLRLPCARAERPGESRTGEYRHDSRGSLRP
jgi:hypothetical protein